MVEHNEGYIFIKAPKWWRGSIYSEMYCFEHHYIYVINTGIYPKENEIIHHIDGNPKNNDFSNLELTTRKDHPSLHKKEVLYGIFQCVKCGKIFKREMRNMRTSERYHKPAYCSTTCRNKLTWNGRPEGVSFETCYLTEIKAL